MEAKKRGLIIGMTSAVLGAILGAVSGSRNLLVVIGVAAVFSALIAWGISGMIK